MRWMNLEPITQSEVSQKKKDKSHILMHIYIYIYTYIKFRKMVLKNLKSSNGKTDIKNRLMDMGRGEERVRCIERVTWKLTLPYVK